MNIRPEQLIDAPLMAHAHATLRDRLRLLAAGHGTAWDHWVLIAALYALVGWLVVGSCAIWPDLVDWKAISAAFTCFVWSGAMLETARRGPAFLTTSS